MRTAARPANPANRVKPVSYKGWLLALPVVVLVALVSVLPLVTLAIQATHDGLWPAARVFVGFDWFEAMIRDRQLHAALLRQFVFSVAVLAIEIPIGLALALAMPTAGWRASLVLVLVALSLFVPWSAVGITWQLFARPDVGLLGAMLADLGIRYDLAGDPVAAWLTVLAMDVWHWTPLVALLCHAGLRTIPEACYRAASIDGAGRFAVFRHVQLPKLRGLLMVAVLLRFLDSLRIYAEPLVVTGGGPGSATTFLSRTLAQKALSGVDPGPTAAFALAWFVLVLPLAVVLYLWLRRVGVASHDMAADGR